MKLPKSKKASVKKNEDRRTPKSQQSLQKNQYFRSSDSSYRRKQLSREQTADYGRRSDSESRVKTAKVKVRKPRVNISSLFSLLILLGIVSALLYASSVSTSGSRVSISDDSFTFRDSDDYQEFVDTYISSNILSRSKLFFPVEDFNTAFTEEYPEVTAIRTKVPFADSNVEVYIDTPKPMFRIEGSSDTTYTAKYIDANGSVIGSTGLESDETPTIRVDSSALTSVGSQLLTRNEVDILQLLANEITPDSITGLPHDFVVSNADLDIANGRLEVGFKSVSYIARFSTYSDARNQVGALKAILTELYASESGGEDLPKEYIDVRVYEKVFIK